jgi:hypothetical protein
MLTKDWWPLAWFGAFIWFGITGLRNILMSVLGGGGVFRSPLIAWWKLVDWNRLADSLMFTGFSVPLLDYLVKTLLLDKGLGITVSSSPIAVYTVMAVANGSYLASHNLFRGFPAPVAAANFFRSVLSIPIAWAFNFGLMALLGALGVPAPADALQKWAAIISKAASDCVAGLIEGYGDRVRNIRLRLSDYATLKNRMIALCARVETLFPHEELTELLKDSAELPERLRARDKTLWRDLRALPGLPAPLLAQTARAGGARQDLLRDGSRGTRPAARGPEGGPLQPQGDGTPDRGAFQRRLELESAAPLPALLHAVSGRPAQAALKSEDLAFSPNARETKQPDREAARSSLRDFGFAEDRRAFELGCFLHRAEEKAHGVWRPVAPRKAQAPSPTL